MHCSTVLTMYSDQNKKNTVAVLPIGAEIEVLLNAPPDWYLVRTSFGLVGYTKRKLHKQNRCSIRWRLDAPKTYA